MLLVANQPDNFLCMGSNPQGFDNNTNNWVVAEPIVPVVAVYKPVVKSVQLQFADRHKKNGVKSRIKNSCSLCS